MPDEAGRGTKAEREGCGQSKGGKQESSLRLERSEAQTPFMSENLWVRIFSESEKAHMTKRLLLKGSKARRRDSRPPYVLRIHSRCRESIRRRRHLRKYRHFLRSGLKRSEFTYQEEQPPYPLSQRMFDRFTAQSQVSLQTAEHELICILINCLLTKKAVALNI